MVSNKHPFWLALVFTISLFFIGISLGFFLEGTREDVVERNVLNSEINLLDEQLRSRVVEDFDLDCDSAVQSTFDFADKVFSEARLLEEYDLASSFGNSLKVLHKRYDLLRTMLWIESIRLKEECNRNFHTVVYFYDYATEDIGLKSKQGALSKVLEDLKEKYGEEVLLIPIAGNLGLESVDLVLSKYNITELPAIIIDENVVIRGLIVIDKLEKIVFEGNKQ